MASKILSQITIWFTSFEGVVYDATTYTKSCLMFQWKAGLMSAWMSKESKARSTPPWDFKDFSVRNSRVWMTMVYATLAVSYIWWFSTSLRLNLLRTGLMWQGMTNLGNCCKARKPQQDGQAKKDHCIKPNPNSVHSHGTKGAKRREETTVKERCDDKSDECKQQFKRVIFCSGSQGLRWSAVVKSLPYIYRLYKSTLTSTRKASRTCVWTM